MTQSSTSAGLGPTFFIVGAAKSGTSSLIAYLAQHPSVGISLHKEPNYFVFRGRDLRLMPGPAAPDVLFNLLYSGSITDESTYRAQFKAISHFPVRGEASVRYLYYEHVPHEIRDAVPDAKILILLRNPVDRLWSHYFMMRAKYHLEPASLDRAISLESSRIAAGWDYDWHYIQVGRYAGQIRRYLEAFNNDQVKVFFYDDLLRDPLGVVRSACQLLGVNTDFKPDISQREMVGYALRLAWLDKFLFYPHSFQPRVRRALNNRIGRAIERHIVSWNRVAIPKMPRRTRTMLREYFADQFAELEVILNRRLPASW